VEGMLMNIFLLLSVPLGLFMFYHSVQGLRKQKIMHNLCIYRGEVNGDFIAVIYTFLEFCSPIIAVFNIDTALILFKLPRFLTSITGCCSPNHPEMPITRLLELV